MGKHLKLRRPSHATVVAYLALFVALGGGAYAASQLGKNSVGTKQLRKNAVTSVKVKDGSLKPTDFAKGALPVTAGTQGAPGAPGEPGTTLGYLRFFTQVVGLPIDAAHSKNVSGATITQVSGDTYCISGLPFTPHSVIAQSDMPGSDVIVAASVVDIAACGGATQVEMTVIPEGSTESIVVWFE